MPYSVGQSPKVAYDRQHPQSVHHNQEDRFVRELGQQLLWVGGVLKSRWRSPNLSQYILFCVHVWSQQNAIVLATWTFG